MTNLHHKQDQILHLDTNYIKFLTNIKEKLGTAQLRVARAVALGTVQFYWELGKELLEKQKTFKWGEHFLTQLSHDMRSAHPGMQGFSVRNLQRMKQFATLYPDFPITPQSVAQLPWGHICQLIHMVKETGIREWYAQQTIKNGWSRSILEMQIESRLYERQAPQDKKLSNYQQHLPRLQSDLAHEMLKDPYNFDFLTIQGEAHERAIEDGLIAHIRDFLLELGQGFAFVGSQVPLTFDDQEFFIDLLFYHLHLRCYVVIELKATKFKPEHTGQLGFYLAATDDLLKSEYDNKTIGLLLCKSKNKIVAEYALSNINAPIGISEYTLSKALPKELKTSLPTIEEIEAKLNSSSKIPINMDFDKYTHLNIFSCYLSSANILRAQGIEAFNKNSVCGGGPVTAEHYYITAFFLYRHTLELGIKALIKHEANIDIIKSHNIKDLWEQVPNWEERIPQVMQEAFDVLRKHNILEDEQLFRYHQDLKENNLQNILPIDEESFTILDQAAWAVNGEIEICERIKKGLSPL